jgi:hypothetical protein
MFDLRVSRVEFGRSVKASRRLGWPARVGQGNAEREQDVGSVGLDLVGDFEMKDRLFVPPVLP